jgi:DTW domain-containing protein YfiP
MLTVRSVLGTMPETRAVCQRCRRPVSVCYCRYLPELATRTRVVLLQHPRERDVAIGTARMASLCLPDAELLVGVKWSGSPELTRALSDPARPAVLLYPGGNAIDISQHPPKSPVTLIVVDGTWWQAKKLVRENPEIARLPRYSFIPRAPSQYRIRKEPDEAYVSTIEALAHVLGVLEDDPARFQALLSPFRAMIDAQIDHQVRWANSRPRHNKAKRPRRPRLPASLHERREDLVCVVGEANAWPYHSRASDASYPDELVHWAARRLDTGETFDGVLAPRHALAPATPAHVRLSRDVLARGESLPVFLARWRAFVRDADVVCSWGRYATSLFVSEGGFLPETRIDLRHVARLVRNGKVGTLEGYAEGLGVPWTRGLVPGRAGERLGQVAEIAAHFRDIAGQERAPQDSSQAARPSEEV